MQILEGTSISFIFVLSLLFSLNCKSQSPKPIGSARIQLEGQPGDVIACDVNHDSYQDLIITDQETGTLNVLLGNGSGEFSQAENSPLPAGNEPGAIASGDFNGDQHMDIAIANHESDYLSLFLGKGDGQFAQAPNSPIKVQSYPHPHGIAAGDFNGDGNLDLATESWQSDEVLVLLGDGNGEFLRPHARYQVGNVPYYRLQTTDLNQDGRDDIITSNWEGASISVLLAKEAGGFAPVKNITVNRSPFAVVIGDVNHDGIADLVTAHREGNAREHAADGLSFIFGNGKGEYDSQFTFSSSSRKSPTSLAIGDFNGDGKDDVAVAKYTSGDVALFVRSNGTIQQTEGAPFKVGKGPIAVILADLNGDGKDDIVAANSESNDISIVFAPR